MEATIAATAPNKIPAGAPRNSACPTWEMASLGVRLEWATHGVAVVSLRGEVDLYTAPLLRSAIARSLDDGARAVVIDLSQVTFFDASGLGVVAEAAQRLAPYAPALVCRHPQIVRVLQITGLDRILAVSETRGQALRACFAR
jgi:anti-sigma B factor antagonist